MISSSAIPNIIQQSRISLIFSESGLQVVGGKMTHSRRFKACPFEVQIVGGFVLTEPAEILDDYFDLATELTSHSDANDLAAKITHFHAHPAERDAIANRASARVRYGHDYATYLPSFIAQPKLGTTLTPLGDSTPTH